MQEEIKTTKTRGYNTYLLGYFPLISIMLFSLSAAVYGEGRALEFLETAGIYQGMQEILSAAAIKIALLFVLFLVFFMIFAALKLICDTGIELSLLFFSKDADGDSLKSIRNTALIYFIGGAASLLCIQSAAALAGVFLLTTFIAFVYFVYKISPFLSGAGLIGVIFFQVFGWALIAAAVAYAALKLYNSITASLPI